MTPEQIEAIASRVVKEAAKEAVKETLLTLGFSVDDPLEAQRDMQYLRAWRRSLDQATTKGMLVILTVLVTGTLSAIVVGIKSFLMNGPTH